MQRRTFLTSLIAAAVLDPEKLLWVPGRKTFHIPRELQVYVPPEYVWINLRETESSGIFSNGGRYPNDVVTFLRVDELSPKCQHALEQFKQFCRRTFGEYVPPVYPVHRESEQGGIWVDELIATVNQKNGGLEYELGSGWEAVSLTGTAISRRLEKPAWVSFKDP